jgi:D-sedoheptulose 7-phosphate isomerase
MEPVEKGAEFLSAAAKEGRTVFVCGNGGSAADAQHFAAEWVCRYKDDRRPLAAIALTVDSSAITSIGNDYGFEHVFSRQIEALGKKGDILLAITTSGISKNVVAAIVAARARGLKVIVLTGEKGEHLKSAADVVVAIPSNEVARIQEMHELIIHIWCECVDIALFS